MENGRTADGLFEIPPVRNTAYLAFCDPSGGSSDAMTLAIAHHDDGVAVLDCVREVRAPFQPEAVVADFCTTLAAYGVAKVTGDRYAGEWPREQFAKRKVKPFHPQSCSDESYEQWSHAALACSDQRNGSPERQTLCKITESFLASATRALPLPDRLAIARA